MRTLLFFFIATLLLLLNTCSDNPLIDDENNSPGSRNIEWIEDTLKLQGGWINLARIWGDNLDNVWAICYGGSPINLIWNYGGQNWTTDSIPRQIQPSSLFGFNKQNIWIGNQNSTIWKFNGINWELNATLSKPGFDYIIFEDIWGASLDNFFAVGFAGNFSGFEYTAIIAHYNGSNWKLIDLPTLRVSFITIRRQKSTGLYFLNGVNFETNGITNILFTFDGKELKEIYSEYDAPLNDINGEVYFVIRQKIYKYKNEQLVEWKDFTGTNFGGRIWGRSENDFYCKTYDGIGHYNGNDLQTIYKTNLFITGGCVLNNDSFFIADDEDNGLDIIIRGKIID